MNAEDLDYALPPERIAQAPVEPRDAARLLLCERSAEGFEDAHFRDLERLLGPDDLLVVNDSKVIPARLRAIKPTGGKLELLLVEPVGERSWRALVRSNARLKVGLRFALERVPLGFAVSGQIEEIEPDGTCKVCFRIDDLNVGECGDFGYSEIPDRCGEIPLPPYIRSGVACEQDAHDYQTVFAADPGSVAAPTAGLHFTEQQLRRLTHVRITLHVGPGTFRPVRGPSLNQHRLEPERFEVSEAAASAMHATRARGGRVIAVGTTVVRALETTEGKAGRGHADLLIQPGHRFAAIDGLITNFHLPRSSLLALVMAFAGIERTRRAYQHAIANGYRFYSYGDAMWIR